jgi:hypothetical protein
MVYEVWDLKTSNLLQTFPTKGDALAVLCADLATFGATSTYVETMALLRQDARGHVQLVAERAELVERTLAESPKRPIAASASRAGSVRSAASHSPAK